ncbi:MAG TPA: PAS domain-containing protein, partial [Candidatus Methylomirabilis sp.]|nr:PAS domain-containing protein [Candidatus Methylomirabilis sp.]
MSSRRDPLAPIDRAGRDPLGHASAHLADREPLPWVFFLVFLVGAALVVTAMWYHIEGLRRGVTARWRAAIETIADDRARLVDHWLAARRADAEVLAGSPAVRSVLWIKSSDDSALVRHLDQVAAAYGYTGIVIFDTGGHVVARSATAAPDAAAAEIALAVARTRKVDVEMVDDAPGRQALVVSAPVFATGTREPVLLGVVSLSMNPQTGPFRLLSENTPIRSDETLLFRLDPRDPVYLSPLRHASAGWAAVTRSVEALQELAGRRAFGEIADYRAEPVLAAVRPIPGTGWGLAFKVDRDEVMEEFNRAGHLTGAAGAFLLLALAGFLIAIWRQRQRARLLHGRVEHERAISNLRGYAEKIVASVPSGLLLLSADLVVLSVNPSFLETFRLREDEVLGHPLLDVIHADGLIRRARDVVQSGTPQRDVLLDLHLTARQETRPVVVTMTGIRLVGDEPARLLLIVQDLTEEERLQAARRASEERFRDLVEGLDAIVWEADAATLR